MPCCSRTPCDAGRIVLQGQSQGVWACALGGGWQLHPADRRQVESVVFYGRHGDQGLKMFNLSAELPRWRDTQVLDGPGGPGSLAALLRTEGCEVTAVDPLWALAPAELERRALVDLDHTMAEQAASDDLRPDFDLKACRQEHFAALEAFLADCRAHPDRHVAASLPQLPFADRSFDLAPWWSCAG